MNHKPEIVRVFKQEKWVLICITIAGIVISQVLFSQTPKKFKTTALVNISATYFQNPLVRDFVAETSDPIEVRSEREALMRKALSPAFLQEVAGEYGFYGATAGKPLQTFELQGFERSFEVIWMGANGFFISFSAPQAELSLKVLEKFLNRVEKVLLTERRSKLLKSKVSIEDRLQALQFAAGSFQPLLMGREDLLREELARLEEEVTVLKTQFSAVHPRVKKLEGRIRELKERLHSTPSKSASPKEESVTFKTASIGIPAENKELYQDLLKKYHFLEISIKLDDLNQKNYLTVSQPPLIPSFPIWPKRGVYLMWGLVLGFLISGGVILIKERKTFIEMLKNGI